MALFNGQNFGGQQFAGQLFGAGGIPPPIDVIVDSGGGGTSTYYRRPWRTRTTRLFPELDEQELLELEQQLQEDEIMLAIIINAVTRNML